MLIKKVSWFDQKNENIFSNDLYKWKEQKVRVNDNNFVGRKIWIQLVGGILEKGEEWVQEWF